MKVGLGKMEFAIPVGGMVHQYFQRNFPNKRLLPQLIPDDITLPDDVELDLLWNGHGPGVQKDGILKFHA